MKPDLMKIIASLIIKLFALSGMFVLAAIYDGYFISLFFLIGGLLLGIDLAHLIKKD